MDGEGRTGEVWMARGGLVRCGGEVGRGSGVLGYMTCVGATRTESPDHSTQRQKDQQKAFKLEQEFLST